jgi:hypothetical protein
MWEYVQSTVSVLFFFDGDEQYARPVQLLWRGQEYSLGAVQSWHVTRHEGVVTHHYLVSDEAGRQSFWLGFETENLTWQLERVCDNNRQLLPNLTLPKLAGMMG